jgi:hypothetical protein
LEVDDWLEVDVDVDVNELDVLLVLVMMEASGIDVALAYYTIGNIKKWIIE